MMPTLYRRLFIYLSLFFYLFYPFVSSANNSEPTHYVRFLYQGDSRVGILEGDKVKLLKGDLFDKPITTDIQLPFKSLTLLPATKPSKIIAVGLNYASHFGSTRGTHPRLFSKLPSSITSNDKPIWLFPDSNNLHFEGELVMVIGKKAHNITVDQAPNYIFGVTVGNDVTDRTWQSSDLQWMRGKGADSFAPVSSVIAKDIDYQDLTIETRVNGVIVQSESTKNLLFNPAEIVSYASRYATLYPGDLIFTGTPGRTRPMSKGDVVEVIIKDVGSIRNQVTPKQVN